MSRALIPDGTFLGRVTDNSEELLNSSPTAAFVSYTRRIWPKWEKESIAPKLTFGIEWEFLVALEKNDEIGDPDPEDPRALFPGTYDDVESTQERLVGTLKDAGLDSRTEWAIENVEKDEDWRIDFDTSVSEWQPKYEFNPIEVKSPPFYYYQNSRLNVSAVSQLLTHTHRLLCNDTCGLHIHVGNAKKGFHPRVLSNLAALLWTFEDRLMFLHSESRRTGEGRNYCRRLREISRLGMRLSATPEGTKEGLKILLELGDQDTAMKIVDAIGGGTSRAGYNFNNLEGGDRSLLTIEFRQHEGLVEFAERVDSDELAEFLWSHIDDKNEDYTVIDLLRAIGRPTEADFYEKRLLSDN